MEMRREGGRGGLDVRVHSAPLCSLTQPPWYPSTHTHPAGWYTNVNNTRWSYQVVNAAMPGYEGWVGLGGAVFIRSRTYSARVINYRVRPYLWVVSGQGVAGGVYNKCVQSSRHALALAFATRERGVVLNHSLHPPNTTTRPTATTSS